MGVTDALGYIFIFFAALLNIVKAYSSKKLSKRTECLADNIDLSILRNIFCVFVGALFILLTAGADFRITPVGILICALSGLVMSVNYVAWVMALKTDAIVFASVANNANFIVVAVAGIFVFDEMLTWYKGAAIVLIIAAMFFMIKYQKGVGGVPKLRDFALLFTVFLAGGLSSVTEKCFARALPDVNSHIYTFYAFGFSILILSVARIFIRTPRENMTETKSQKLLAFIPHAAVMGVAIYGVTYFKTAANAHLETIVLYPLNNGLTFVGSCIMAWICFGERPNKNSIIGMLLVFCALLLSSGTVEKLIMRFA